jgi:hypothetical protein
MERVKGIEPSSQAWEARILPLNHTRAPNAATSSINQNVSQLLFWPGATCLGRYSTADCPTRMNPLDQKRMSCPACSRALTEKQAGSVSLIVCQNGCGGVWFDALELDRVDEESEAVGELLLHIERDIRFLLPNQALVPFDTWVAQVWPDCRMPILCGGHKRKYCLEGVRHGDYRVSVRHRQRATGQEVVLNIN